MLLTSTGFAAGSDFLLGLNYTEWGPYIPTVQQIAVDSSGALYILSKCTLADYSPACLTKLAADGKTVLWRNNLESGVAAMAVDPSGCLYLIPVPISSTAISYELLIEKLSTADGATVLWSTQIGEGANLGPLVSLAVDSTGRAFIAGSLCNSTDSACVIRLNTAGAIDATFPGITAQPTAVAVDPTGSYVVVACEHFLPYTFARLAPDNTTWVMFNPPLATVSPGFAVAPNGDAVVYGSDVNGNRCLQRIDPTGAVVFSKSVPSQAPSGTTEQAPGSLALDAAGNVYITGYTGAFGIPTRNSLASCGSAWVSVYAPDGTILQTTYLPGATGTALAYPLIALAPGAALFVLAEADTAFTPIQTGPLPQFPYGTQSGSAALFNLSPNAGAQTLPLACVANGATFGIGAVAPGEIVSLFGNSLGPSQGVQSGATLQNPFPTQSGGAEVIFDGTPAPLLWVQDSQINLAVPWSVAGPTTQICVTYNNAETNCLTWPVAQAAPGVFTVDGTYAAALNQDGTPNSASNPAPPNSIVSIFATGLGPVTPPQLDGSVVGFALPVNAYPAMLEMPFLIGLVPAASSVPTSYAGPAPFLIAGASQINFNSNDLLSRGPGSYPYLLVQTPSGTVTSNSFRIYVAGATSP
jgi:uncharacterized protein (TIGR03437 family)